jgi:hypothetical protein
MKIDDEVVGLEHTCVAGFERERGHHRAPFSAGASWAASAEKKA